MKNVQVLPVIALASLFALLLPNSAMAISDYQTGYDDGYAAAQVSNGVYTVGDACENQSTQYCNGFIAGYTTEFFTLYQNLPPSVFVKETGPSVVVIHPHQYYYPHPPFVVVHRPVVIHPHSHYVIGPPSHHSPVFIQPHGSFTRNFGETGPDHDGGHGTSLDHGGAGPGSGHEGHRHDH